MNERTASTAQLTDVVAMYVHSKLKKKTPISTRDGIRAVPTALPSCKLNDQQLGKMIARAAIKNHQVVIFESQVDARQE